MTRFLRNSRGVALMLVLSAITLLTMIGVEFAYNTSIYYDLAQNEADRLKAYYLAKSAYSFMQLELKFDRVFQQVVQSQNLAQFLGQNAHMPLCRQFPLSTGLIRAIFLEGAIPGMEGAMDEAGEADDALDDLRRSASISQEKLAQEFLDFEGDFDGECEDEGTKIDLNGFAGLSSEPGPDGAPSPFEQYKRFLFRFMSNPRFATMFEEANVRITDVVNNIGDWIDPDSEITDFGGRSGGSEAALYQREGLPYQVRNGRLVTLLEAYLIVGVLDEWFAPMMNYFTIYGDGRISVCTADEEIVEGLIRRYVDANPDLPPLRLEDPEEMGKLLEAIGEACVSGKTGDELAKAIAQSLDMAIGLLTGGATQGSEDFASYVGTGRRFFTLKLAGQVGDITVKIKAVLDTMDADPKKWSLLYWRVY